MVVLVHGLGMSSRAFRALMPRLASDFRLLAPDLPGCGDSERPSAALSVDDLVGVLVGWLDALGVERADFVGHSPTATPRSAPSARPTGQHPARST
ncbi:alpha/beta fold hydrolase [Kineosphaera limosa]|uniref:alpha/beta fold hydrolase n=1 Tax=Kineosphaera limosa TaxID=111564 RepID=UPI003570B10D